MKCINKLTAAASALILALVLAGCGNVSYEIPYNPDSDISSFNVISRQKPGTAQAFASDLGIVTGNLMDDEQVDMSQAGAALLVDVGHDEVMYAKNALERMYPASITKIMTAIVALKYGSLDSMMTATDAIVITEPGAQLAGLKVGDRMTLNQGLHIMLVSSANDAALMIAENVAGSVEAFVDLMNKEALSLGATNTHFANPHGLTDETHYTTAYDLYLIMNEAIKYEQIQEIIRTTEYQTTYHDKNGEEKSITVKTTNRILNGTYQAPSQVTVIGGKTGTTNAAGHCLLLLSRDTEGTLYISVILRSTSKDVLYAEMLDLLDEIEK